MLMCYRPHASNVVNESSLSQSLLSTIKSTELGRKFGSPTSGQKNGPGSLPLAVESLVYHGNRQEKQRRKQNIESEETIDRDLQNGNGNKTSKTPKFQWAKGKIDSCNDYLDRRATARYVSNFPLSLNLFPFAELTLSNPKSRPPKIKAMS